MDLAREAYEAYANHTGWKSLVTGANLPQWELLPVAIKEAWQVSAAWVAGRVSGQHDWLIPTKDELMAAPRHQCLGEAVARSSDIRRRSIMTDPLRSKAEAIARDLMNHHTDRPAERLVLIDRNGRDQGGWGFLPLVDRIHKHLLELEEDK